MKPRRQNRHTHSFLRIVIFSAAVFSAGSSTLSHSASAPTGNFTYTFTSNVSQAGDNYQQIITAMDSAIYYYNTYTTLTKKLTIEYNSSVQTADGNSNGNIRFGSNKTYQVTLTAMHEIAHTLGIGTTQK